MKRKKRKRFSFQSNNKFFLFIIVILITLFIFFMNYEKDCRTDMSCFNDAMELCVPANVISEEEGNIFEYKIRGKEERSCLTTITINQVNSASGQEVIDLFEGKSMTCLVPKGTRVGETNDVLDYCSGPLKESMYELIIQKMYTVVIQNLGETISELSEK